jgi:hypothetical protein
VVAGVVTVAAAVEAAMAEAGVNEIVAIAANVADAIVIKQSSIPVFFRCRGVQRTFKILERTRPFPFLWLDSNHGSRELFYFRCRQARRLIWR